MALGTITPLDTTFRRPLERTHFMASGRLIIFVMAILGMVLLGGYELVRRSATPRQVEKIEDRGAESGEFDRVYHFLGERYRVREGEGEGDAQIGTVIVSNLAEDGTDSVSLIRTRVGRIDDAFLLELDNDAPPKVIVIFRSDDASAAAEGVHFTLEGDAWQANVLESLPRELLVRYLGNDEYVQEGAFLYRTITLDPLVADGPTLEKRLFYDFQNQRWQVVQ